MKKMSAQLLHDGEPKSRYSTDPTKRFDCAAWFKMNEGWNGAVIGATATMRNLMAKAGWDYDAKYCPQKSKGGQAVAGFEPTSFIEKR